MEIGKLRTEGRNPRTMRLDEMEVEELLSVMNEEDAKCALAVREAIPAIAEAVKACRKALPAGGRMIYMGAGTSGRLGVLDASECGPTFSSDQVIGLIAGGEQAMVRSSEGAEDHEEYGEKDLRDAGVTAKDVVIGLAASGRTPYVIGGLKYARKIGACTVAVSCNKNALMSQYADIAIEVDAGPEVLSGSSRLKSGTCEKLICNMLSTAAMAGIGKVYGNLMVDMDPKNEKLKDRAVRIIAEAAECGSEEAAALFEASGGRIKTAIVMGLTGCGKAEAEEKLEGASGFVRKAVSL